MQPGPESGRIGPDNAGHWLILLLANPVLDENGRRLICIKAARLGVDRKRGAKISRICRTPAEVSQMLDFVMIAMGIGFFVASIFYVLACERM